MRLLTLFSLCLFKSHIGVTAMPSLFYRTQRSAIKDKRFLSFSISQNGKYYKRSSSGIPIWFRRTPSSSCYAGDVYTNRRNLLLGTWTYEISEP